MLYVHTVIRTPFMHMYIWHVLGRCNLAPMHDNYCTYCIYCICIVSIYA